MSFISKFSEKYQIVVQSYCDKINKSDAQKFIAMARKGVCFNNVLKDNGYITLDSSQEMIASSALDFIEPFSSDTKVVITDDIMISGTSIAHVVNKLIDWGIDESNIRIVVLAVDSDNMNMDFSTPSGNILCDSWQMTNADCIELSSQISNLLSLYDRPYDVDFPVYKTSIVSKSDLPNIFNNKYWNIYNVTNIYQSNAQLEVFTLLPTSFAIQKIWNELGVGKSVFAHFKIRVYLTNMDTENISLQFVPLVLFYEMNFKQLDDLTLILTGSNKDRLTPVAKMRLCQFILSHRLGFIFSQLSECKLICSVQDDSLTTLFGDSFFAKARGCLDNNFTTNSNIYFNCEENPVDLLDYAQSDYDTVLSNPQKLQPHFINNNNIDLNVLFLDPFISWFLSREQPVRDELHKRYHFRNDRDFISKKPLRLNVGYSFRALASIFIDNEKLFRWPDAISIFLDRAIDMGIIVPIIFYNVKNNTICRAFRHGEDLPFGVADRSRLLYFLHELQEHFQSKACTGIAQVSFEKILVLFLQMALREGGIFNQFLGFGSQQILSIRYSVHGTIATTIESDVNRNKLNLFFDKAPYWDRLKNFLETNNIISLKNNDLGLPNYYISNNAFSEHERNFNNICSEIRAKIDEYASLFAEWYGSMSNSRRDEFKAQSIQLSTCFSLPSATIALATELHYFTRYWNEEVQCELIKYTSPCQVKISGVNANKVLNSAKEKYEWYETKQYLNTIEDVKSILSQSSVFMANAWSKKWQPFSEMTFQDYKLTQYFHECYCYILLCRSIYELLICEDILLLQNEINPVSKQIILEIKQQFEEIKQTHHLQIDDFDEIFAFITYDVFQENNIDKRIDMFLSFINQFIDSATKLVDTIQESVSKKPILPTKYYDTVAIVELFWKDDEFCSAIIEQAWDHFPNDELKTKINILRLNEDNNNHFCQRYCILAVEENQQQKLVTFIANMITVIQSIAERNCINSRFILAPQLPDRYCFRYNAVDNLQENIYQFIQNVYEPLTCFMDNSGEFASYIYVLEKLSHHDSTMPPLSLQEQSSIMITSNELGWEGYKQYVFRTFRGELGAYPRLSGDTPTLNSFACIIQDNKVAGTATVFSYNNEAYALICEHCLNNKSSCTIQLKQNGYKTIFAKKIYAPSCTTYGEIYNEITFLSLYWDAEYTEKVHFESDTILKLHTNTGKSYISPFRCFGYPNNSGTNIETTRKPNVASGGLLEFEYSSSHKVEVGFSGALVRDRNDSPVAIVVSRYKNANRFYGIPIEIVAKKAERVLINMEV